MQKVFITGHSGMVGSALVRSIKTNRPDWELLLLGRKDLNLLDQSAVDRFMSNERPKLVINAAANVNVTGNQLTLNTGSVTLIGKANVTPDATPLTITVKDATAITWSEIDPNTSSVWVEIDPI